MDTNNRIEVKKLEIEPEKQGFAGWIKSKQVKRSLVGVALGLAGGIIYYFITGEHSINTMDTGEIFQYAIFGGLFGLFATNSPCARNKC